MYVVRTLKSSSLSGFCRNHSGEAAADPDEKVSPSPHAPPILMCTGPWVAPLKQSFICMYVCMYVWMYTVMSGAPIGYRFH